MVLNRKIKANTLPEVLIAIVIITCTSAIGMAIYMNIQENTQPFIKLKATELANKYLLQSKNENDLFDKTFKEEEFTIKKTITRSNNYPDCVQVNIVVSTQQEKKLCDLHQIIYAH